MLAMSEKGKLARVIAQKHICYAKNITYLRYY